jgi:hypothetical protein
LEGDRCFGERYDSKARTMIKVFLFVISPHADDFNSLLIFVDLINKAMLVIYAPGIITLQIPD